MPPVQAKVRPLPVRETLLPRKHPLARSSKSIKTRFLKTPAIFP
jgi:hypothetical protein